MYLSSWTQLNSLDWSVQFRLWHTFRPIHLWKFQTMTYWSYFGLGSRSSRCTFPSHYAKNGDECCGPSKLWGYPSLPIYIPHFPLKPSNTTMLSYEKVSHSYYICILPLTAYKFQTTMESTQYKKDNEYILCMR